MGKYPYQTRLFESSLVDQDGLLAFAQERCQQSLRWGIEPLNHLNGTGFMVKTPNSFVSFVLDPSGESLHAKWWVKSLWDVEGTYLAEDDLFNETDIVGWISVVKTDMINAGVKRLIALFQGRNLFPEGAKPAIRAFTESSQVFCDFLIEPNEVVEAICKALAPMYRPLWQVKGDSWALPLDGLQVGAMVARIDGNRTKWRIKVPFSDFTIDFRGHFGIPPGNPTALDSLRKDMPDLLLRKMVESVIVGYLSPKVPAMSLPPEWVHARNQVTDGWTT